MTTRAGVGITTRTSRAVRLPSRHSRRRGQQTGRRLRVRLDRIRPALLGACCPRGYRRRTCSEDGRRLNHRTNGGPGGHERFVLEPRQGEDLHRLRSDGRPDQGATWGEKPKLVFQFECATRGKTMFREQEKLQLLKRFRQSLDPDAPWVGFYTVGEIGPVEKHNLRHLYTSVVLALS
jgi:FIST-like protein